MGAMTASKSNLPRPHGVSIAEWMGTTEPDSDEYVEGDGDLVEPVEPVGPAADPTAEPVVVGVDLAAVLGGDPTK